jgi:dTDP-4-dehydrorhamnose reductase
MMPVPPILVTGGSGQIGGALARISARRNVDVYTPTRNALDLTNESSIRTAIREGKWLAIVNCAAFTAVDRAEQEQSLAQTINSDAPRIIAEEAERAHIPLVQVSTDYVFDGKKATPYDENDPVKPINVYGKTKEFGEAVVRRLCSRHAIVRTAWVNSAGGANFLNTMLRLGSTKAEISVVDDQIGNPSNADDIAEALLSVALNIGNSHGTWHFVNSGDASWHDLATFIFAEARKRNFTTPVLHRIPTSAYPTPAERPANSRLSTVGIQRDFEVRPRDWENAIADIVAKRLS